MMIDFGVKQDVEVWIMFIVSVDIFDWILKVYIDSY